MTDRQLLLQFAQTGSQAAMGELVCRHIDFVYASALRQTRNPHLAEDVTQNVFITLAKKARRLSPRIVLEGWLYNTVRFTALNAMRHENRIKRRERIAARGETVQEISGDELAAITPHLDEAMAKLNEPDRQALLLRFFKGMSLRDVGAAIGISEDGARMRINRGLEKLRGHLAAEGVTASAMLPVVLEKIASQNAPAHLGKQIMGLPLAPATATSLGGVALAASFGILVMGVGALSLVAQISAQPQTPPSAPAAAVQSIPATASASTQPLSPTYAIKQIMDAFFAGNKPVVQNGMLRDIPQINAAVDSAVDYIRARGDLINAVEARFGPLTPQQKNVFERGITGNATIIDSVLMFAPMDVKDDVAVIHMPKSMKPHEYYLKLVDGTWKFDPMQTLEPVLGKNSSAFDMQAAQYATLAKSCDDITSAMQAEVYPTQADVLKAFTRAADDAFTRPTTHPAK